MNKIILTLSFICILFSNSLLYAQSKSNHISREDFKNRQKEYFIKKVELTPTEAEKFFPIYFELQDKKAEYNKEVWNNIRKGNQKNVTDSEYAKISEDIIKTKITIDKLELEYLEKYKKVLSPKKIYNIQRAEMRFHRDLIKDLHEKKNNK